MKLSSGVIELAELVVVFSLLLSQEYKSHVNMLWKLTTRSLLLLNFLNRTVNLSSFTLSIALLTLCPSVIEQLTPESSRIVIIGDFNLPSVKWSSHENVPVNNGRSNKNEAFCEMVDDNFLQQFISGPTHIVGNKLYH
jgi:hypothetical protein